MKVGITGGIGSGKTTVCKIFEALGIPVYYADTRAKWLMAHDPVLVAGIKQLIGTKAYFGDGGLNRAFIAEAIFGNNEKLQKLNHLVHPAVAEDSERWHNAQKGAPYTLKEAALFFESGNDKAMDKMITVFAPEALRIQRVVERDQSNPESVRARMDKQMPEEEKIRRSDYVIHNDGQHSLIHQVMDIHRELLRLSQHYATR
ncbi:MAG: dephospho-CoA kinase [Phaeodactylibacter sp.]|nr:dephospho-CoA kinase [Phaeodactylibacter sp.]MCB9274356.1 dephospho-CoA kinase [Lewinellaceae bacterium]